MQKLDNLATEIWKSAERLRGKFKGYEYQNVILPIIVIRRLECVLIKWREDKKVELQEKHPNRSEKEIEKVVKQIEQNPKIGPSFSNQTKWTLRKICEEDPTLMEKNFRAYLKGVSANVQDIIEHFDYRAVVGRMVRNSRLSPILNQIPRWLLVRLSPRIWKWVMSTKNYCGASQSRAAKKPENILRLGK